MYAERVLSINNGWSLLANTKEREYEDILRLLTTMDEDIIIREVSDRADGESYISYYLNSFINSFLFYINNDWVNPDKDAPRDLTTRPKVTKNGVCVSNIGFNESTGGDFITNLILKAPYYYTLGLADITVLLVPTQVTIEYFLKAGVTPIQLKGLPTEEYCRAQLPKFVSLLNRAPAVLIFFSPSQGETFVEEVAAIEVGTQTIERIIEFAPEFYQAGVGLLSYFGEVLRQKDPNTKAKVRIEQEGNTVRLHIVPPVGEAEVVEKQLEQFALVISGQTLPESLLDSPGQIVQLKAQLRMAQMQIETAYDIKQLTAGKHAQDMRNLEQKIDALTQQVAKQVLQQGSSYELL